MSPHKNSRLDCHSIDLISSDQKPQPKAQALPRRAKVQSKEKKDQESREEEPRRKPQEISDH